MGVVRAARELTSADDQHLGLGRCRRSGGESGEVGESSGECRCHDEERYAGVRGRLLCGLTTVEGMGMSKEQR
jgi:hypothetical protein